MPNRQARARGRLVACALASALAFAPITQAIARAAPCPAPVGATQRYPDVDARARVLWISSHLDADEVKAGRWSRWWGWGIAATGVASLAVVPFVSSDQRVDWYTSAAEAAVGVLPFVLAPLDVLRDAPKLRASVAATSLDSDAHACALLSDAERMLREDAADERFQRRWFIHAGNVAFNTGVLLFLGLGFHHWGAGLINGIAGAVVGEGIILTTPTGAIEAEAAYERGELTTPPAGRAPDPTPPRVWGLARSFAF